MDIAGIELVFRGSPRDGGFLTVDVRQQVNEYGEFLVPDVDNPVEFVDFTNSAIED